MFATLYCAKIVVANRPVRGGSRIFSRRGCTRLLLHFNTNKPHSFFFLQNTSCIRKLQVISGGEGAQPLHPPPRSAPDTLATPLFSPFLWEDVHALAGYYFSNFSYKTVQVVWIYRIAVQLQYDALTLVH